MNPGKEYGPSELKKKLKERGREVD